MHEGGKLSEKSESFRFFGQARSDVATTRTYNNGRSPKVSN